MSKRRSDTYPVVGWREWVRLDGLTDSPIKAKIDTGAVTSSLHAFDLQVEENDGAITASFEVHPVQRSSRDASRIEVPVLGFRKVRSSSGHRETRPVIRTPITIGPHHFNIDMTLTSRDNMGFRMLLGRAAMRRRFLVNPSRSFQVGDKP